MKLSTELSIWMLIFGNENEKKKQRKMKKEETEQKYVPPMKGDITDRKVNIYVSRQRFLSVNRMTGVFVSR